MVYRIVPFCIILKSLLGVVILWAIDFFPFLKNVSGVQILLTIKLFRLRISVGPTNFNLSSVQVWRKKTSIVYSWKFRKYSFRVERWLDKNSYSLAYVPSSKI
jgi:hypothetical protein